MRHLLIFICSLFVSLAASSQTKVDNLFQFNYIASSGGGNGSIAGLKYIANLPVGNKFTAGAGIGHDFWFDNRVKTFHFSSVLADVRYYFRGNEMGSNFFATPGYAVKVFDGSSSGFNLNTGLGSKIPLNDQQKLMVGLGFAFHNVDDEAFKRNFRGVTFNLGIVL